MATVDSRTAVRSADGTASSGRAVGKPGALAAYQPALIGGAAVVIFVAAWQIVAAARIVPTLFLPAPTDIALAFQQMFRNPEIWIDLQTSGIEVVYGFGLAIVVGLPLGILMGWYRPIRYALDPFMAFFYSVPRIALAPLLIIWFGIGIWSKVAVIFLGAFFPIAINAMAGIKSLDPLLLRAARSFGARDAQIFRTIALPGTVPFILTGIRLGIGHALIGVVVAELLAGQYGIGKLMQDSFAVFNMPTGFAALIIIAASGVILTIIIQRIERRFDAWRPNR
ncbi:MAG TPA: ABC transporter permease [Candidatus Dormibacteraeota bacterium]|nr:ABC transporter permease [Candidatus Dormibacteraeota bacterium]